MPPSSSGPLFDHEGRLINTQSADADVKALMRDPSEAELLTEIGDTGLNRHGGTRTWIFEEWLAQLKDPKARYEANREMVRTATAGGVKRAIALNIARLARKVEPPSDDPKYQEAVEFVESCFDDMTPKWGPVLDQILTCLEHGWSWFEIVMKRREGPNDVPWKHSEYEDGLVGWGAWGIRSQKWLNGWVYAPRELGGHLVGMRHLAPPDYREVILPIKKSLHFRLNNDLDNPEGESILRTSYRNYWFVKRLEELEGVGLERDLAGLPVARVPPRLLSQNATPQEKATLRAIDKMLRGVRRDAREGIIFPLAYDSDHNEIYRFELMSAAGSGRQQMIDMAIRRHESRIAQSMLADFMMLGQEGASAAYALSADKTALFLQALDAIADMIAEQINLRAIPLLYKLNGWDVREMVKVSFESAKRQNIAELATYISTLSTSGIPGFTNNVTLTKHLFKVADLPEPDDELLEQDMMYKEAERNVGLGLTPDGRNPMEQEMQLQEEYGMNPGGEGGEEADPEAEAEKLVMQERVKAGFDPFDGETPIIPGKFQRDDQQRKEELKLKEKQLATKPAAGDGKPPIPRKAPAVGGSEDKPKRPAKVQKATPRFDERKIRRSRSGRFADKPKWLEVARQMLAERQAQVAQRGSKGAKVLGAELTQDDAENYIRSLDAMVTGAHWDAAEAATERATLQAEADLGEVRKMASGLRERYPHLRPRFDGLTVQEVEGVVSAIDRFAEQQPEAFAGMRRLTTQPHHMAPEPVSAAANAAWRGEPTFDVYINPEWVRQQANEYTLQEIDRLGMTASAFLDDPVKRMDALVTHETAHGLAMMAEAKSRGVTPDDIVNRLLSMSPKEAVEQGLMVWDEFDPIPDEWPEETIRDIYRSKAQIWNAQINGALFDGPGTMNDAFEETLEKAEDAFNEGDYVSAIRISGPTIYSTTSPAEFFAENYTAHVMPGFRQVAKRFYAEAHPDTGDWIKAYEQMVRGNQVRKRLRLGYFGPEALITPPVEVMVKEWVARLRGER